MLLLGIKCSPISWAAATSLLMIVSSVPSSAATPDELIAKCDGLASDARDPEAYAAPVEDGKVARGAALDACGAAIEAKPDFARGWYELGRAQHLAGHDADAFHAYAKAATLGYAAAMGAIGDAYFTGQGLPTSEHQSTTLAIDWYNKAINAGDSFAREALSNAQKAVAATKFDSSIFQNPEYMSALYSGNVIPPGSSERAHFLSYMHGVADALGGDTIFFIDQDCQHNVAQFNLSSMEVEIATLINKSMLGNGDVLKNGINFNNDTINGLKYDQDLGTRDGRTLMHAYSCKSPIVSQITGAINTASNTPITPGRIGGMLPGPMGEVFGALLGGASGLNSRTPAPRPISPEQQAAERRAKLIADVTDTCDHQFVRPGFCQCAATVLRQSSIDEVGLSALRSDFHNIATFDQNRVLYPSIRACFKTPA